MVWNWGLSRAVDDMRLFGEDTIWYGWSDPTSGGVFRTTNGGVNWEKRDSGIPANNYPDKIYFYNSRIGFAYQSGNTNVYKTTDAGLSWSIIFINGFSKLYFLDSLNGYKAAAGFFRTSNGGVNWSKDSLPNVVGNYYTNKWVTNFQISSIGTIYAIGASAQSLSNFLYHGIVYKTTNSGLNWGYQFPDTSYNFSSLSKIFSINKNNVWIYSSRSGIYSSTGGDSTVYLGINLISNEVPKDFQLFQNYPNPFNNSSKFKIKIAKLSIIKVVVYDIQGREVQTLIEEKLKPGVYECTFNGNNLSSGIYFYQLIGDNKIVQTKKMALLK
jgi:photosystem II stability/assembly factor-like uncharacterized protein